MASRGGVMTILPVLKRELVAAARRGGEPGSRSFFAAAMLMSVLGTFTAWYYWEVRHVTNRLMALVAKRSFFIAVALHGLLLIDVMARTAQCVAEEKDRRTLDFLLATRLSSTEVILGKLAARMLVFLVTLAAGLPIMLLLNRLGGVDGWLILMAYAGIVSTGFFLAALSIWLSATAPDSRRASAFPHLQWIGIGTGEGPLRVAATCLIGILAPALGGMFVWRNATAHFDRLVGRPWRVEQAETVAVA